MPLESCIVVGTMESLWFPNHPVVLTALEKTCGSWGPSFYTLLPVAVSTRNPRTLRTTLLTSTAQRLWLSCFSIIRGGSTLGLPYSWDDEDFGLCKGAWSGWTGDWSSGSISLRFPTSSSSSMHDCSIWITYSKSSKWNRCQEPTLK